ncbi:hypothetical protein [Rossellomorea sp. NS-SX7]|uniref:hypothetical protein n=1 Tax=Rossellomorea sp. NS-SX7 TaxID=3463856 RepID=UPI004058C55C
MERRLKQLRKAMDSTTHRGKHFTEFQKNKIRNAVNTNMQAEPRRPHSFVLIIVTTLAICLAGFFISTEVFIKQDNEQMNGTSVKEWKVNHEYKEGGETVFSIFPDPELQAGKPYGYIFHFNEPFSTYKGKELSISAVHKGTGQRMQAVPPQEITEPSEGYSSLERFTTSFQVPYSGLWRYEVYLDGKVYGDAVVKVSEKEAAKNVSLPEDLPDYVQEHDVEKIDWNRKAAAFGRNVIGNENQSGIIGADMPSLTPQKWMWHLWGTDASELTVVGYHKESKTVHPILNNVDRWTIGLGGENNGADVHAPSSVTIPERGEWAILLYADGELFDVIVLDINH